MTESPRLPAGVVRPAAGSETAATEAELNRMAELARRRDARTAADPDLRVMAGGSYPGWAAFHSR